MEAHAQDLRAEVQDRADGDRLIDQLRVDYRQAALSERERAILDYAVKLTLHPADMRREDVEDLRRAGLDDGAIHDVAQVTGFFNLYNRLADGLGIEAEPDW
ncbi:MAG: peroxidase-related enzyme [Acidobacteria bacterium]|nr:peroxidase-related enzyme [Acidobacteriota bacterium]MCZ6726678.1 peroxidase-related enzyme [Acidobacteriota bacterium]